MKRVIVAMLLMPFSVGIAGAQTKEPPFQREDITFKSTGDITLAGSLTLPNGKAPFPAVVLLGGSERLNRTGIYRWTHADHFVERGIAVFSFDSPGRGKSEGDRWKRTHAERTDDALAAVQMLAKRKDIDERKIGLYGTSEGGVVTFRAASQSKSVAFGVTISAPAVPFKSVVAKKVQALCLLSGLRGTSFEKLVTFNRLTTALALGDHRIDAIELTKIVEQWNDPTWSQLIALLQKQTHDNRMATRHRFVELAEQWEATEWFRKNKRLRELQTPLARILGIDLANLGVELTEPLTVSRLLEFDAAVIERVRKSDTPNAMLMTVDRSREEDPVDFLEKITCPMLCIYGEQDHAMSTYPRIVRDAFSRSNQKDWTVRVFEGAGHQLEVTGGKPVAPKDLRKYRHQDVDPLILDWVLKRVTP